MDLGSWWIVDVIGPVILLLVLVWLILNVRSNRSDRLNRRSEKGAHEAYAREEQRRREGTGES